MTPSAQNLRSFLAVLLLSACQNERAPAETAMTVDTVAGVEVISVRGEPDT
jgi:hypothetical protein